MQVIAEPADHRGVTALVDAVRLLKIGEQVEQLHEARSRSRPRRSSSTAS
jgi:hypothetical protein